MKILLTGATGLIGSRFMELMHEKHEIIPLSSSKGVNITDADSIAEFLEGKDYEAVVHLAGKTDVDACELDKAEDLRLLGISEQDISSFDIEKINSSNWKGSSTALGANFVGTLNLYKEAKKRNARFFYISSDFVFGGNAESYDESSKPEPVDWYGASKFLGERVINLGSDLVVRISFPYGYKSEVKKDVVWKLHDFLQGNSKVSLISDQVITPTFIDDIVLGIDFMIDKNQTGIIHLTGSSSLSPKEIGEKIKKYFGMSTDIGDSRLDDIYKDKARRPRRSIVKNDMLKSLGFTPKTFDQGLALISSK